MSRIPRPQYGPLLVLITDVISCIPDISQILIVAQRLHFWVVVVCLDCEMCLQWCMSVCKQAVLFYFCVR